MSPKWIIFIVMVWVILALLGGIIEGAYLGSGEASVLNTMMNAPIFTGEGNFFVNAAATFFDSAFWGALFTMLLFDFAMFEGTMAIFQWLFFMPIAIGVIVSFSLAFFRGVGSG